MQSPSGVVSVVGYDCALPPFAQTFVLGCHVASCSDVATESSTCCLFFGLRCRMCRQKRSSRRSSLVTRGSWLVARRVDCQVATSPGSTRDCCHTNTRPTSIPKACTCTRRFARRERVLFCSGCAFREPRFTIFVIGDSRFAIRGLPFDRRVRLG